MRFPRSTRDGALAIALAAIAISAHAESVTLVCQNDGPTPGGGTFTLRVDYDRKTVDLLRADGAVRHSAAASITASNVTWKAMLEGEKWFEGSLNRLSGQGLANFPVLYAGQVMMGGMSGPCRRGTQKF